MLLAAAAGLLCSGPNKNFVHHCGGGKAIGILVVGSHLLKLINFDDIFSLHGCLNFQKIVFFSNNKILNVRIKGINIFK